MCNDALFIIVTSIGHKSDTDIDVVHGFTLYDHYKAKWQVLVTSSYLKHQLKTEESTIWCPSITMKCDNTCILTRFSILDEKSYT